MSEDRLAGIDPELLDGFDRQLYDSAVLEGAIAITDEQQLLQIRNQLVFLPGTEVDLGDGPKPVAQVIRTGDDQFIADTLSLIENRGVYDENNYGCALLLLDDEKGWKRGIEELEEAVKGVRAAKPLNRELGVTLSSNLALALRIRLVKASLAHFAQQP